MRKSTKYLLVVFASICTYSVVSNWLKYQDGNSTVENTSSIEYLMVKKFKHKGGRGSYYTMEIVFNRKEYTVDITKRNYGSEKKIELFYSNKTDSVYSLWTIKRAFRLIVLSTMGLLIIISIAIFSLYKKQRMPTTVIIHCLSVF